MKRIFYISLMSLLGMMITTSLYFVAIYGLVMNRVIPLRSVICFTDISLSRAALLIVALIGILIGYRAGKKWWQIIYVDGVYYFNKALKPVETPEVPMTPRARRMRKTTKTQE